MPPLPLTDSQIGKRLHRIGIWWPKQARSTALFTLALEVRGGDEPETLRAGELP
ncbi:hypothetical protein [Streptomyces sviceus]|uniref:hypothetical protein n=1 Tax=Streptomyces sviceus TaxID=285530 RepID=UPI0033308106